MGRILLVLLLLATLIGGCSQVDRSGLLAAGYNASYVDGYVDGYSTGCKAVGHPLFRWVRDISRYDVDLSYQKGWNDGFTVAKVDYAAVR